MCKWVSFLTSQTLILYIKDTISVLGWKLRPLPAYTVLRHIHWQGINLKFGMLLRPKCWQLIQIWWEHTHTHTQTTVTSTTTAATLTAEWACCTTWTHNVYCTESEAQGMAAWPHAYEWTFGGGNTGRFDAKIWKLIPSGLWFYMWKHGQIFVYAQETHKNTDKHHWGTKCLKFHNTKFQH